MISRLLLHDEFPERGLLSPLGGQATGVVLHLYFDDVDDIYQRGRSRPAHGDHAAPGLLLGRSLRHHRRPIRPPLVDGDAHSKTSRPGSSRSAERSSTPSIPSGRLQGRRMSCEQMKKASEVMTVDHCNITKEAEGVSAMRMRKTVFASVVLGLTLAAGVGRASDKTGQDQG